MECLEVWGSEDLEPYTGVAMQCGVQFIKSGGRSGGRFMYCHMFMLPVVMNTTDM